MTNGADAIRKTLEMLKEAVSVSSVRRGKYSYIQTRTSRGFEAITDDETGKQYPLGKNEIPGQIGLKVTFQIATETVGNQTAERAINVNLLSESSSNSIKRQQLEDLHKATIVSGNYESTKKAVVSATQSWVANDHYYAFSYYEDEADNCGRYDDYEKEDEYALSAQIHLELHDYKTPKTEASLAMTPVGGGKIRQVAKPPKAPKADAAPKPVDPGESGSKSAKPPKKKAKKSSKIQDEHIEGDSHVLNFKHDDQDLTGWIEDRGDGTFDVAVVCGKFTVVKGVTKDTVVKKVKAAAAKLCGDKEIEEGRPDKAGADMLYDKDTDEKIPDNIEDNDSEETDEFWMFKGRDKKNKKDKKSKKNKRMEN